MAFVPGTESWLEAYTLATPSGSAAFATNIINVVIPTDAVPSLVVNGAPVDPGVFAEIAGSPYSVANLPVTAGVVTATADVPFQLSLAGYDRDDSYLTFGGASFAPTTANIAPLAANDAFATAANELLTGNVLVDNGSGPDRDINNDALTVTAVNGIAIPVDGRVVLPSGSVLQISADGAFAYTAGGAFATLGDGASADETFTYTISDGRGGTDEAAVTVTVTGAEQGELGDLSITLPDNLGPGEVGTATITRTLAEGETRGDPILVAVDLDRGLVADPFSGAFSDTAFVLLGAVDTSDGGTQVSVDVEVKGTAGPSSRITASLSVADPSADPEIAERFAAFQPDYVEAAVVERIERNIKDTFGASIAALTASLAPLAERLESFGFDGDSAAAALGYAFDQAGAFGAIAERGREGSLGQGWSSLADIGLEIDGTNVQMLGLTDLNALFALSLDGSALYTVSNSAGRSVALTGDALALVAPPRPTFEQQVDGRFTTVGSFDGELIKTVIGYEIRTPDGDALVFDHDGIFLRLNFADGRQIIATHDDQMQIVSLDGPNNSSLDFQRSTDGTVARIENADGETASFTYNANGQLVAVDRDEGRSTFAYDIETGDLVSAEAPGAIVSEFTYDAQGRILGASYGGGLQTETFTFDEVGRLTITDGAGRETVIDLLPGSLPGRVSDGAGNTSELVYGDDGTLSAVRAPDGTEARFQFDEQGRLTGITDANGAELSFTYGETGEDPTSFTDAGGGTRSFAYDEGGRIVGATWPDGTQLQFEYDDQGNLTGYANRRGTEVEYTYDERGRLLNESDSSAGATSYVYDAQGRLVSATNEQGTTTLTYDSADRVTQIDYPTGKSLFYTYNAAGLRASMSDGGDYNIFYEYDALGRITGLRDEDSQLVSYEYDAAGNLVREENGNGTVSLFSYDEAGRLTRIENQAPDGSINSYNAYTYDVAGQRIANETQDGTWSYGYDAVGQLISASFVSTNPEIADKSLIYEYDAAGNRTRVVEDGVETLYTANELNQYTQVGDATFTYDADGNMTSRTDSEGTTTYTYDLDNRLTSVTEADGTVLEFEYDVFGNRVAKTVDGVETEYLVDPFGLGDVVSEFTDGALSATYAHGLGLTAAEINGVDAFYDSDVVGTVTTVTGSDGGIQNKYVFTPFGTEVFETETVTNNYEFNGSLGVLEDLNELYYMGARQYSSVLGRFISEDPLWLRGDSANLFRFAANSPLEFVDPDGDAAFIPYLLYAGGVAAGSIYAEYKYRNRVDDIEEDIRQNGPSAEAEYQLEEARIDRDIDVGVSFIPGLPGIKNKIAAFLAKQGLKFGTDGVLDFLNNPLDPDLNARRILESWDGVPRPDPDASFIPPLDPDAPFDPPIEENDPELIDNPDDELVPESSETEGLDSGDGNGRSDGDPHLSTFDGVGYSFQAVGEFTLMLGEAFEIQVRQVPLANSTSVSVNEALAMRIGDSVVGVYANEAIPLVINGTAVVLARGESLAVDDGSVYFDGRAYILTDAEGNGAWVRVGSSFLNIRTFVGEGDVAGLLGNNNDDRTDDFQLRDGTVLTQPLAQTVLYGEYADSWRITQDTSLFLYRDGESTETFTDRNFPANIVTLDDLDPTAVAAAEQIAIDNGLTPGTFEFETTVLDIVLTGSEEFAEGVADAREFEVQDEPVEVVELQVNAAPIAVTDTAALDEDTTVLIDVLVNDTDAEGDALTLLSGSDLNGGLVSVVDGQLQFTPTQDFNGSTTLTYSISDTGGNTVTGQVDVSVNNVPDQPVAIEVSGSTVMENAVEGTVIGELSTLDPDVDDTFTYSLSNDASGRFAIAGASLVVAADADIDFEAQNGTPITVTIVSTDTAGLSTSRDVEIFVTDVNEAPTSISLSANQVEENAAAGTVIGVLSSEDQDQGDDSFTFAIADDAGGLFTLDRNTVVVASGADLDFEAGSSVNLVVTSTDAGGLSATQALTIELIDLQESFDGTSGDDLIIGDAGNNEILAGAGDDRIDGGRGDDRLTGGEGADTFVLSSGNDVIEDFFGFSEANQPIEFLWLNIPVTRPADKIDLTELGLTYDDFVENAVQNGDDVVWIIDEDTSITIVDTDLDAIVVDDFLF